ncbi:MAG: type II toxin-antitoxin system RelE/ParE family toxin [Bacteroidales bacterium]|nr:type II toxin-antitoxin system RelE/ParE family toxin [Bacteroidales bacterium]
MIIRFGNKKLMDLYLYPLKNKNLNKNILYKYIDLINFIKSANSINSLSKISSLNIEKYKKRWTARINKQYRLEFDFEKPNTIIILKISKHYE